MKKVILIVIGFIFLTLGVVGIVIPLLPTAPFVILASICFSVSSKRLSDWIGRTKYFGAYVRNHRDKLGVEKKVKVVSLCFLWLSIGISAGFVRIWYVWLILGIVGIVITLHILLLKTKKNNKIIDEAKIVDENNNSKCEDTTIIEESSLDGEINKNSKGINEYKNRIVGNCKNCDNEINISSNNDIKNSIITNSDNQNNSGENGDNENNINCKNKDCIKKDAIKND